VTFLIIAPYKYSYLLTYLLRYLKSDNPYIKQITDQLCMDDLHVNQTSSQFTLQILTSSRLYTASQKMHQNCCCNIFCYLGEVENNCTVLWKIYLGQLISIFIKLIKFCSRCYKNIRILVFFFDSQCRSVCTAKQTPSRLSVDDMKTFYSTQLKYVT